jgi:hypothetical protein
MTIARSPAATAQAPRIELLMELDPPNYEDVEPRCHAGPVDVDLTQADPVFLEFEHNTTTKLVNSRKAT